MKYAQIFALGTILALAATAALTGCTTVKEKWGELWQKNKPQIELPTPEQPPTQATDDEVDFSKLQWTRGGENFSKAVRDPACAITGVKIRGGGTPVLSYGGEGFQKWPVKDENVTHIWAIFFDDNRDGIYERGGKFDWGRSTAADRPLAHLTHYKGWDGYPKKGTPWAAVITDIKGKKRSNVATGVWP
jgi:hypothetical protein